MIIASFEHDGHELVLVINDRTTCLVAKKTAYVFKPSSSSYGMVIPSGHRKQFVCQDGCCDRGLQPDVSTVVEIAKEYGAELVVLRTGQRGYYVSEIAGLPVEDVSGHVGEILRDLVINRR